MAAWNCEWIVDEVYDLKLQANESKYAGRLKPDGCYSLSRKANSHWNVYFMEPCFNYLSWNPETCVAIPLFFVSPETLLV